MIRAMGISPRQFEQMKDRVSGRGPRGGMDLLGVQGNLAASLAPGIVLGVDPSLRGTGYGIIRFGKSAQPLGQSAQGEVLAQGTIRCPRDWERSRCLAMISTTLREIVRLHRPEVCAVEGLFFAQNLRTALIMGEARGAAMAVAAEAGLPIHEIATRKVKQAVVGYGAAQKAAVAKMVQRMLALAEVPEPDAADALALALTHFRDYSRHRLGSLKRI